MQQKLGAYKFPRWLEWMIKSWRKIIVSDGDGWEVHCYYTLSMTGGGSISSLF